MPAPKGHPKWGDPRKPKKYTPDKLWDSAQEYFNWCDENPIITIEQSKMPQRLDSKMVKELKPAQIKGFMKQLVELPKQRAYSVEGLCIFLNISDETYFNYSKTEGYETYFGVCQRIKRIIDNQYFEGGMAGTFNANIVTRKLGLVEKQQTEHLLPELNITVNSEETKKLIEDLK